jgi:predicted  nucleic acid-binding Zn-ribbon protein
MHPAIPQLMDLQRLDQSIAALRTDLEGLPKKMKEADATLTGSKAAVTSAKEKLTHGQTNRKKLELDVEQWKDRAKKYRSQTASVKTNEAYKALLHETANAEAEAAKAEDLVLEQMMAIEESERLVKNAEANLKEDEHRLSAVKKQIEAQFADEKKKWHDAVAERAAVAAKIPENLLILYGQIQRRHPTTALAEVRDNMCRGCGMRVLPHTVQLLTNDSDEEVFRCEMCGRILYSLEPIPHTTPRENESGAATSGSASS